MSERGLRTRRVGDQIRRDLSELIRDSVRDPRLGSVTVSEVEVSRDLGHAQVYVTALAAAPEVSQACVRVLERAAPYLRRELGRRLRLRTIPQLHFHYDPSFDRGAALSRLIDQAVSDDAARQVDPDRTDGIDQER